MAGEEGAALFGRGESYIICRGETGQLPPVPINLGYLDIPAKTQKAWGHHNIKKKNCLKLLKQKKF